MGEGEYAAGRGEADIEGEMMSRDPDRMTPKEAAGYLDISIWALLRLRQAGKGPAYRRKSLRVIEYRLVDLDTWKQKNRFEPEREDRRYIGISAQA